MHLLDPMRVYFAKFIEPGPFYCANSFWEIVLPANRSDHLVDASRSHRLEHVPIVADVNVGGVVANDRSDGRIVKIYKVGRWYTLVDVEGRAVEYTSTELLPTTRSTSNVSRMLWVRRREAGNCPARESFWDRNDVCQASRSVNVQGATEHFHQQSNAERQTYP